MDTSIINFIQSMVGENATNDANKEMMDNAKFEGIDQEGPSDAVKSWLAAKAEEDKFKGKEI